MRQFEMLEKGQSNVLVTTNAVKDEDTIKIYKVTDDDDGNPVLSDITPDDPEITSIANGLFKQYNFTAPSEDCYIIIVFNDYPQMFRVGTPTIRYYGYFELAGMSVGYKIYNFAGDVLDEGTMTDLGNGVYCVDPVDIGDYIFTTDYTEPIPVHTPYIVDSVGMRGRIVFQKDKWMLLSIPLDGKKIADVVKEIEDKYNINGEDAFRIFSAYPATVSQSSEMLDFKPNYTPEDTKYNFQLVYEDEDADGNKVKEIVGFWCKTNNYTVNDDENELIVYEWHA